MTHTSQTCLMKNCHGKNRLKPSLNSIFCKKCKHIYGMYIKSISMDYVIFNVIALYCHSLQIGGTQNTYWYIKNRPLGYVELMKQNWCRCFDGIRCNHIVFKRIFRYLRILNLSIFRQSTAFGFQFSYGNDSMTSNRSICEFVWCFWQAKYWIAFECCQRNRKSLVIMRPEESLSKSFEVRNQFRHAQCTRW